MYNKIITLNGTEYNLNSDIPISSDVERLALQKMGIQTLAKTCPTTSKTVGDTVTLKCTATAGTSPFTITFKKNGVVLTTYTNVLANTQVSTTNVVTTVRSVTYSSDCLDSCINPSPLSITETCIVNVLAACVPIQMSFEVS